MADAASPFLPGEKSKSLSMERTPSFDAKEMDKKRFRSRMIAGFFTLALMIASWVAMSELLGNLQAKYPKPFFITWFVRVTYAIWLVPFSIMGCVRHAKLKKLKDAAAATNSLIPLDRIPPPLLSITRKRALIAASLFCFIATASGYTWYKSLTETITSLNNAIYQSGPLFVFVFSVFMLGEKVTLQKSLAVIVCTTGVIFITFSKDKKHAGDTHDTPFGYVLVVISTALYAIFEVVYAKYIDYEEDPEEVEETPVVYPDLDSDDDQTPKDGMQLNPAGPIAEEIGLVPQETAVPVDDPRLNFWYVPEDKPAFLTQVTMSWAMLGLMGVATAVLQWPALIILDKTGAEPFRFPHKSDVVSLLVGNCGLDAVYNVLLVFGISITSPVFISVGTMLVAPITVIVDALKPAHVEIDWKGWVGIVCVLGAFAALKLPAKYTGFHKCNRCEPCRGKSKKDYHAVNK